MDRRRPFAPHLVGRETMAGYLAHRASKPCAGTGSCERRSRSHEASIFGQAREGLA
jgi:hypothetical protein